MWAIECQGVRGSVDIASSPVSGDRNALLKIVMELNFGILFVTSHEKGALEELRSCFFLEATAVRIKDGWKMTSYRLKFLLLLLGSSVWIGELLPAGVHVSFLDVHLSCKHNTLGAAR